MEMETRHLSIMVPVSVVTGVGIARFLANQSEARLRTLGNWTFVMSITLGTAIRE